MHQLPFPSPIGTCLGPSAPPSGLLRMGPQGPFHKNSKPLSKVKAVSARASRPSSLTQYPPNHPYSLLRSVKDDGDGGYVVSGHISSSGVRCQGVSKVPQRSEEQRIERQGDRPFWSPPQSNLQSIRGFPPFAVSCIVFYPPGPSAVAAVFTDFTMQNTERN